MANFLRGARPSPRHRLAAAFPHVASTPTPPQFLWKPKQLSMWGNADYGDCTVAEEAFAKGATAGLFIPDAEVIAWAQANGAIDGDTIIDVLDKMQAAGFALYGSSYNDGAPSSVDWTNSASLQNAIAQGPVKIGVAADQLQTAVNAGPTQANGNPANGWLATGFTKDLNLDHCTSLCGYGPIGWLVNQLNEPAFDNLDIDLSEEPGYALFTWDSIGIIDVPSLIAICGEAWLRVPSTVIAATKAN
jgi:hypothetical protein